MTISLPGSKKRGLSSLLVRQKRTAVKPASKKQLEAEQIAKLFKKGEPEEKVLRPAKLKASEREERESLGNLRGALYRKR